MKIAVAGGTGAVGRHVVREAHERGHEVVVLARANGVDLMTGEGASAALAGVDAVIDVSSRSTQKESEAVEFFGTATRTLLAAAKEAGVPHHVALSIVGIDETPYAYYLGKREQERILRDEAPASSWTILRATQFHEFAAQIHGAVALGPISAVPQMLSQPIAAREVASRLVELAEGTPQGRVADLAGPAPRRMVELVRAFAKAAGRRGAIVAVPLPGPASKPFRDGALLPGVDAELGRITFEGWLESEDARILF